MNIQGNHIGFALTGSFCTFHDSFTHMEKLVSEGANVYPIFSYHAQNLDSRFGNGEDFVEKSKEITGQDPILSIVDAEPFGPKKRLDILIIFPCSGNTLAKLANGITDTPALMAAKAHLRGGRPLLLFVASNDALGFNMKNIGLLLNSKNIFFVPFAQDDYKNKPNSLVADSKLLLPSLEHALKGQQIQPLLQRL